ncbi:PREDICTED: defensin-like protein 296 [Camelina sativa]|uniref:Defensin-like protein 296 n=1 Tax=Camelina sativa TaxID=90675 RepID=A0ABM0ZDB7_CAMSA|nr:PREDICTED: defensin-like protein 296 [Camelina sativa]
MASKIIVFSLLALVVAYTMMVSIPIAEAELVFPCKTTYDCESPLPCSGRPSQCIKGQCKCTVPLTHQEKLDNLITMDDAKTCKLTSDCDPRMKYSCSSGSYMCVNGVCTCI